MASPLAGADGGESRWPRSRRRAALVLAPFVALGVADVLLILEFGANPLFGFAVLPPILFVTVVGWIAIRSGFVDGPGGPSGPEE